MSETAEVDRVSLKSNGKTPTKEAVKQTVQRFTSSFKRAVAKGSKDSPRADSTSDDVGCPQLPPSPSEYQQGFTGT